MGKRQKWQSEINDAIDVGDVIAIAFETSDKSICPTLPCMITESNRSIPLPLVVISMKLSRAPILFSSFSLCIRFLLQCKTTCSITFFSRRYWAESISVTTRCTRIFPIAMFSLLCNPRWPLRETTITSPHRPRWFLFVYHYILKWEYVIGTMIPIDPRYLIYRTKGRVVIPFYISCAIPVYSVEKSRVNFARFTICRGIW